MSSVGTLLRVTADSVTDIFDGEIYLIVLLSVLIFSQREKTSFRAEKKRWTPRRKVNT